MAINDTLFDLLNKWKTDILTDNSGVGDTKDYVNQMYALLPMLVNQSLVLSDTVLKREDSWDNVNVNTLHYFEDLGVEGSPDSSMIERQAGYLIYVKSSVSSLGLQVCITEDLHILYRLAPKGTWIMNANDSAITSLSERLASFETQVNQNGLDALNLRVEALRRQVGSVTGDKIKEVSDGLDELSKVISQKVDVYESRQLLTDILNNNDVTIYDDGKQLLAPTIAVEGNNKVIAYNISSNNLPSEVKGYQVETSTDKSKWSINTETVDSGNLLSMINGTKYYVRALALPVDASDRTQSNYSDIVEVTVGTNKTAKTPEKPVPTQYPRTSKTVTPSDVFALASDLKSAVNTINKEKATTGYVDSGLNNLQSKITDNQINIKKVGETNADIVQMSKGGAKFYPQTHAQAVLGLPDLDEFTLNPVNPWMNAVSPDIETQLSSYETTINKADGVVRILNLQDTHTSEAAIGDANYQLAAPKSINQIRSLSMIADDIDLVVANGDNINGNETKAMNIHRNRQFVDTVHGVFDSKPALITLGNHDDGSVFDTDADVLTLPEMTDIMGYSKYAQGENRLGGTATYSYYDFKDAKLRVISLDGFENPEVYNTDGTIKYKRASASVFTEAQLKWLVQALTLDADWHVIIFNHSPFKGFYGNTPYSTMADVNHDVLNQILQAFANATTLITTGNNTDFPVKITADFSKQAKGMLIACVFGHEHRDAAKQVIKGVPAIERTCNIAVGNGRTVDTVSAYGIDVIEVDTVNKTINFNRFGAGSSVKWNF